MSAAEKIRKRRNLIINMLMCAPENRVYGADLRDKISSSLGKDISKATLSSDIKALIDVGYEIISDTNGYKLLNPSKYDDAGIEGTGFDDSYEPISRDIFMEWIIMVILSEGYDKFMSIDDMHKSFEESLGTISKAKLKEHLDRLIQRGYIGIHTRKEAWEAGQTNLSASGEANNKLFYHISDSAPVITFLDKESVMDFSESYRDGGYAGELGEILKKINDNIAEVSPEDFGKALEVYKSTGRRNDIPEEATDRLDEFLKLPYKNKAVNVEYREGEKTKEYVFKTALIFFNVETNGFYLLGEVRSKGKWIRKNLKLSAVISVCADETMENDIYESRKYKDIFNKMWSAAPDEPSEVEVLFKDTPAIRKQLREIGKIRNDTAVVTYLHDDKAHAKQLAGTSKPLSEASAAQGTGDAERSGSAAWIRYRDRIMGTHDFLRFVRSMGDEAVIIKPEKSREHIIAKTREMMESYRELLGGF